jgi:hypothetical protein
LRGSRQFDRTRVAVSTAPIPKNPGKSSVFGILLPARITALVLPEGGHVSTESEPGPQVREIKAATRFCAELGDEIDAAAAERDYLWAATSTGWIASALGRVRQWSRAGSPSGASYGFELGHPRMPCDACAVGSGL